jgi:membrane associated rhomboid family serine protease
MRSHRQLQSLARRWSSKTPTLWAILIAINVGVFATQTVVELYQPDIARQWLALSSEGIRAGYYWQFLTYMFLHQGPVHLIVNMLALFFAGREVETIIGRKHLIAIYLIGGLAGGIAQLLILGIPAWLLGASACVCAVVIAFTTILPELEVTALLFFIMPLRLKAKYLAMGLVAVSAVLAVFRGGTLGGFGHVAHLGGCLVGWLYVRQLGYGNSLRLQRYFFEKRQRNERLERMPPAQFISQEIDPILDKIARDGIHSLTRAERRILEKGRDKIAQKTAAR